MDLFQNNITFSTNFSQFIQQFFCNMHVFYTFYCRNLSAVAESEPYPLLSALSFKKGGYLSDFFPFIASYPYKKGAEIRQLNILSAFDSIYNNFRCLLAFRRQRNSTMYNKWAIAF